MSWHSVHGNCLSLIRLPVPARQLAVACLHMLRAATLDVVDIATGLLYAEEGLLRELTGPHLRLRHRVQLMHFAGAALL